MVSPSEYRWEVSSVLSNISQKASRVLGAIKFALYDAPKNGKLLAYTSLCRLLLEYADTLRDPYLKTIIHDIEMVQNRAARFISDLKGQESVSDARCELGLLPLQARRKNHRLTLLTRILQSEATHSTLSSDYDEVVENRSLMSVSLEPHCAYFHMGKLKSQVAKVSTVRIEKTFEFVVQHSQRKCESSLSSSPNWLVVIQRAQLSYFSASFQ